MKCFVILLDFHFNRNKRITGGNQNGWLGTYKNTNLILKTTEWVMYKVLSSYFLHLFPLLAAVSLLGWLWKSLLFSLRLHVCVVVNVVVFIHEKENWQCFSRLLSRHFPPCFDHVLQCIPSGIHCLMYHDRDTFDFSQGHVTKNQPMAVPV